MTRSYAPKPPSKALRAFFATLFFVLLVAGFVFGMELDVFSAGADCFTVGRFVMGCVILGATFPALLVVGLDGRRWMKITYASAAAASLLLSFVPWHPRLLFVHRLYSLRPGMTVDDVEAVMGRYMKGAGKKWAVPAGPAPTCRAPDDPPSPEEREAIRKRVKDAQDAYVAPAYPKGDGREVATGTMTYRWSDDGAYDSDWGQVEFKDGRVVSVEFLAD